LVNNLGINLGGFHLTSTVKPDGSDKLPTVYCCGLPDYRAALMILNAAPFANAKQAISSQQGYSLRS
jgi:hypothetical protein